MFIYKECVQKDHCDFVCEVTVRKNGNKSKNTDLQNLCKEMTKLLKPMKKWACHTNRKIKYKKIQSLSSNKM